jgi:hypothetical protein
MKNFVIAMLFLALSVLVSAQSAPTTYMIEGQNNFPCQDGYYSHAVQTQGACSYHGGFASSGGGNESCDAKCKEIAGAAVGGVVLGVAIGVAIHRHHEHVKRTRYFCTEYPWDMADKKHTCAQWLEKHKEKKKK